LSYGFQIGVFKDYIGPYCLLGRLPLRGVPCSLGFAEEAKFNLYFRPKIKRLWHKEMDDL
jgi:hypothetical protein